MGRGEKRLFHSIKQAIDELYAGCRLCVQHLRPRPIGDDIEAVCKAANRALRRARRARRLRRLLRQQEPRQPHCWRRDVQARHRDSRARPGADRRGSPDFNVTTSISLANTTSPANSGTSCRSSTNWACASCALSRATPGSARCRPCIAPRPTWWCAPRPCSMSRVSSSRITARPSSRESLRRGRHLASLPRLREALGDPDLSARTEALIAREEAKVDAALAPWRNTPHRQARAALHWRRQILVHRIGLAGSGHGRGRHRHQQIHRGRQARIRELMGDQTSR